VTLNWLFPYPLVSKVRYLYSKKFSIEMGLRGVTTHPQYSRVSKPKVRNSI
jgi:hypothetical protein